MKEQIMCKLRLRISQNYKSECYYYRVAKKGLTPIAAFFKEIAAFFTFQQIKGKSRTEVLHTDDQVQGKYKLHKCEKQLTKRMTPKLKIKKIKNQMTPKLKIEFYTSGNKFVC